MARKTKVNTRKLMQRNVSDVVRNSQAGRGPLSNCFRCACVKPAVMAVNGFRRTVPPLVLSFALAAGVTSYVDATLKASDVRDMARSVEKTQEDNLGTVLIEPFSKGLIKSWIESRALPKFAGLGVFCTSLPLLGWGFWRAEKAARDDYAQKTARKAVRAYINNHTP